MDGAKNFVWIKTRADGLADVGEQLELFGTTVSLLEQFGVSAVLAGVKEKDDAEEHRCQRSQEQRDVLVKFHCTSQTEAATRGLSLAAKQAFQTRVFGLWNYSTTFVNPKKIQGFACTIGNAPVTSKKP